MEGSAPSEPAPPPPPLLLFSPPASFSLALPPPRTLRRREGELPGVLRGELLAVLEIKRDRKKNNVQLRGEERKLLHISLLDLPSESFMSCYEEKLQAFLI